MVPRPKSFDQARKDSGQVLVEAALTLPLVILFFLALFQLGFWAVYRFTAEAAAHGGARCAAVGSMDAEVILAANEVTLAILRETASVRRGESFGHATVEVTLQAPFLIPGLQRIFGKGPTVAIKGRCQMIQEPE